jgi:hypothetical protein
MRPKVPTLIPDSLSHIPHTRIYQRTGYDARTLTQTRELQCKMLADATIVAAVGRSSWVRAITTLTLRGRGVGLRLHLYRGPEWFGVEHHRTSSAAEGAWQEHIRA